MRRYKHNLSYYHLNTLQAGFLYPAGWWEVLPGDTMRFSTSAFLRHTPLLAPVMHPNQARLHWFFCPWRLVEPNFEDFITQAIVGTSLETAVPVYDQLDDWLHLSEAKGGTPNLALLTAPRKVYSLIWEEYYRDQELQNNVTYDTLAPISYEKDWSTTARFEPSAFPSGVSIPVDVANEEIDTADVRKALSKLRFFEARSRFGSRYSEYLQFLGINPADARLQRPEYLGGGVASVNFSEVLATADTNQEVTGELRGHGITGLKNRPITKFFPEHGMLVCMLSIRPKQVYSEGVDRMYRNTSYDDWWQKEHELEGQQAIRNYEIYHEGDSSDLLPFGYQDRYYYYRQRPNRVGGEFRDLYDFWHMARQWANRPGLNSTYTLVDQTASRRPHADQNVARDPILAAVNHRVVARRLVGPANRAPRTL